MDRKRIMVLGGTGMLGHTLFRYLSMQGIYDVYTTARSLNSVVGLFPPVLKEKIRANVDADNFDAVTRALAAIQPDIVINCIGLIKQLWEGNDPLSAITVNAQLPHRLSMICRTAKARMIHISTDCVFSGKKGMYAETDFSDANDIYGRTKFLGEVSYPHCVTLRTSIIGHELKGKLGLLEWFLSQTGEIRGFTKAIFSGLSTIELAKIIHDHILPNSSLSGIYHISSQPVSKHDLLCLIAKKYNKKIEIEPYEDFVLDRSLDSSLFHKMTGYQSPSWDELIESMYDDFLTNRTCYVTQEF